MNFAEEIRKTAVIGAGQMGHGIAQSFAQAGYPVMLHDITSERVEAALDRIRQNLDTFIANDLTTASKAKLAMARITGTTDLHEAVADADLLAAVRQFPRELLALKPQSPRAGRLMQGYYDSVARWGEILGRRILPVPGHPDWSYYGRGGHNEDDVRPITYAAMVNAFLSEVRPPGEVPGEPDRLRMRREAIAALRYLTSSHVTGGCACLDGKPWGDQWQSAMWARAVGMAGWLLWPHLDGEMKLAVARLVEHEADRFIGRSPKSSEFRDTGAEENAWNSQIVSLAANMMPTHPRASRWHEAAKRYMYNSLSVAADHDDKTPGDDGRSVGEWVTTVNAHPDFTVENHGLVHVGYLKNTVALLMESAGHYLTRRAPVPRACLHHVPGAVEILYQCAAWDGAPVFFGGNDWKIFHSQATDVVLYAMVNLLTGDARAAYVEQTALDWLRRIQQHENGYYNVRRDLEYGGFCATRLISCYLAHAALGEGAKPLSADEFDRRVSGVRHLGHGRAILHRTPTKFVSFSWGPKRMALALPQQGNWVIWPHFASYLGIIHGKDASERNAKLTVLHPDIGDHCFAVAGTLTRFDGQVTQQFAYASLEKDVTVYVERLTIADGFRLTARETGVVGHEYALGTNTRELRGSFGKMQVVSLGGRANVHELNSDWLNVGNRVGYVVRRTPGRENLIRYHDLTKGRGRVPKLLEWFSLIGDRAPGAWASQGDWACVVTFLNQPSAVTADWARRVQFEVEGDVATCRIGGDVVRVDFESVKCRVMEKIGCD